ncbi:MAG TPA: 5-deoxy-glucuronate isomerase [Vicinamibacterales bacterium]|nr:5-deoxy-glucuronate isomerase [Vicinamibacterales bacterium]
MLSETLFRVPRQPGLHVLQRRGDRGARELTSSRLIVRAGDTADYARPDEETIIVLQQGRGTFSAGDVVQPVSRKNVFAERASALCVPSGVSLTVTAESDLEAILVSAPSTEPGTVAFIGPHDVTVNPRGRGTYTREVHDVFVRDPYARRLMVGETFNPPGHWSSFPPHKHDGRNGEPFLEEVYHFRVDPPHGFGHQMLYTDDGESVTHQVRDGDAVLLPYGYHPVSAPPGYSLYYLWAMAGDQRQLALYEDPAHRWIHEHDARGQAQTTSR